MTRLADFSIWASAMCSDARRARDSREDDKRGFSKAVDKLLKKTAVCRHKSDTPQYFAG